MPFSEETLTRLKADAAEITGRYPRARSALIPLLYLVQAEEGYVSGEGMAFCAEVLGITQTEVRGVATFYTMYKHEPAAEYQVGVCTNTTCAIMGGDQIYAELAEHLASDSERRDAHGDGHHRDIKSPDGKVAIERLECNAACDYAPVVMVNWEFFDNQTPQSAK
ncbi:MAG TPA: NAD(P)H-dependent oxidoreductase subunit E, partial [Marmoricola sp.]|nr:NAD(P)H-dependent oxidoreductase subunit E [Marmoricola sp.]